MTQFELDTAVERLGDLHYRGELIEGWRVGAVPNGGYVLAVAGRALRDALPHKDPLSVNAFYLAPTALGPIDCHVEILREARTTSFAQVKMFQEGELRVQVTAAYTDLDRLKGENWTGSPRPEYPAWNDCEPSGDKGVEFRQKAELRLVSGKENAPQVTELPVVPRESTRWWNLDFAILIDLGSDRPADALARVETYAPKCLAAKSIPDEYGDCPQVLLRIYQELGDYTAAENLGDAILQQNKMWSDGYPENGARLEYAKSLAVTGRTDEALDVLDGA